jgi:hypothetical protein
MSAYPPTADVPGGVAEGPFLTQMEEKIPAAPRVCFWCDWARANGNRSAFPYNPAPYGVNVTGHASAFLLTSIENISFRPRTSLKATVRMCWAI